MAEVAHVAMFIVDTFRAAFVSIFLSFVVNFHLFHGCFVIAMYWYIRFDCYLFQVFLFSQVSCFDVELNLKVHKALEEQRFPFAQLYARVPIIMCFYARKYGKSIALW